MRAAEATTPSVNVSFSILTGERHIAVAVSGGSDSLALLLLACTWAKGNGCLVTALTFDHQLRSESGAEARWVGDVCAGLGIDHVILVWDGELPRTGIQAKARIARYDAMAAWCCAHDVPCLLTGHTADDQAETVAMRAIRNDSVRARAGIWPERPWKGVRLLRPLLGETRQTLRDYLLAQGRSWLDDPSNENVKFERVRVRTRLVGQDTRPLVEAAKIAHLQVRGQSAEAKLWFDLHATVHAEGFFSWPRSAIEMIPRDVLDHVVSGVIFALSGQKPKSDGLRNRIMDWMHGTGPSRMTAGGVMMARKAKLIVIGREPGRISRLVEVIPSTGELIWDHRFLVTGLPGYRVTAAENTRKTDKKRDIPAFVKMGQPMICDPKGSAVPTKALFSPQFDFS